MPSASSLKEFLGTLLLATYLPVPFYLLWLHGFSGRWQRIGLSSFAIHIPIYLVMVAAVVYFHSIWSTGAWAWPTALSFLSIIPLGVSVFLAIYTYATIDRRVLHLFQQIRPHGERRLITTGILGYIRHPRYLMFSLGAAGNVLLTGYPLIALAGVVTVLLLGVVIRMEEKELATHFGGEYETYREEVPAFFPRWKKHEK